MTVARERFEARLEARLAEARAVGRGRTLRTSGGIDFSSNDYLGIARMAGEPARLAGSTGSRLLSGHRVAWTDCETMLARWHGGGDDHLRALVFPSGYVANEGLLSTLIGRTDWVASDALNHGSIIDGLRLSRAHREIYRHQDLDHLRDLLQNAPRHGDHQRFVVTESVFGMDGDHTDLSAIAELCNDHDALLIVDEAHATGCLGPDGSGLVDAAGLRDTVLATVHTCGKALGSHGAYVIAAPAVVATLVQDCRHFIFTTALPPAMAEHIVRSVELARRSPELRQRLREHAVRVHGALQESGWQLGTDTPSHILPILVGPDAAASAWATRLQERGLRVPAIRPPTVPEGAARLRISLRADHTDADLDTLLGALTETFPR